MLLVVALTGCSAPPRADSPAPAPSPLAGVSVQVLPTPHFGEAEREAIFFAVLEGCYRDGVQDEVVDKLLEPDATVGWPKNFVWACPICMPVIHALDAYKLRRPFRGLKGGDSAFGDGLPADVTAALLSDDGPTRQAAMTALLERWIGEWVAAHRLTDEEGQRFAVAMKEGREQGMRCLEAYRSLGGTWAWMKECPSCEAGNHAATKR